MGKGARCSMATVVPQQKRLQYLQCREIDDTPALLEQSFALRYQVYCLDRGFLSPEHYPGQLETDAFDAYAVHVGTTNLQGNVVGTARLVQDSAVGFPLFRHCGIFPG